jgi:glutamine synthetase
MDDKGRNIFDNGSNKGSIQLRQAVAGMLDLLPQSMAIFAPNVNSYRRFAPNLYVPTGPTWGYNNRSVAIRIPAGDNTARRIEHRMGGADANPYLTLAAVLAGLHHGIRHELAPPDPRTDNAGTELDSAVPFTWQGALDELAKPSALDKYLGAEYLSLYRQCKQFELDAYAREFTPLEYRWYLAPE